MASMCRFAKRMSVLRTPSLSGIHGPLCARFASKGGPDDLWEPDLPDNPLRPNLFPQTPEERAAAAKKYNMRPEDYEPYEDDGFGWGNYPKFKPIHVEDRDPHADWDFIQDRRNWGEPLHIHEDFLQPQRTNYLKKHPVSMKNMVYSLGGVLTILGIFYYLGHKFKNFRPAGPKQFPYNNLWVEHGGDPDKMPTVKHYAL